MPTAAQSPCARPGCGALSRGRYCSAHKAREVRRNSNARGYDQKWRKLSKRYRNQNPLCEIHLQRDQYVPVRLVDHIVPVHVRPDLRLVESNLQGLCSECHAAKTEQDVITYGSASTHGIVRKRELVKGEGVLLPRLQER